MFTWDDFLICIKNIESLSSTINDGWEIKEKMGCNVGVYIKKIHSQLIRDVLITFEYHIVYNQNYGVPVLCFNCWLSDGALISMEDVWKFCNFQKDDDLYSVLTQMEHPILLRPFLTLHPCRTEEIIKSFSNNSKNLVVSWLSVVGPTVYLVLLPDYIKLTSEISTQLAENSEIKN